jgi:hypothetical protein
MVQGQRAAAGVAGGVGVEQVELEHGGIVGGLALFESLPMCGFLCVYVYI